jgi:MFS family permease
MKLLFKDFILIINTLHALIDIGASIYLGVVLWDIVKDFKIIELIFAAYYILQIFISPFVGSLSDRYRKPVELIGISLITSALSYFILFLGYIYTSILIMCLAVIPFAIAPILYIPNIQIYVKNLGSDTVLYFQAINITSSLAGIASPIIVSTMITRIDIKVFLFIIVIYIK